MTAARKPKTSQAAGPSGEIGAMVAQLQQLRHVEDLGGGGLFDDFIEEAIAAGAKALKARALDKVTRSLNAMRAAVYRAMDDVTPAEDAPPAEIQARKPVIDALHAMMRKLCDELGATFTEDRPAGYSAPLTDVAQSLEHILWESEMVHGVGEYRSLLTEAYFAMHYAERRGDDAAAIEAMSELRGDLARSVDTGPSWCARIVLAQGAIKIIDDFLWQLAISTGSAREADFMAGKALFADLMDAAGGSPADWKERMELLAEDRDGVQQVDVAAPFLHRFAADPRLQAGFLAALTGFLCAHGRGDIYESSLIRNATFDECVGTAAPAAAAPTIQDMPHRSGASSELVPA